MEGKNPMSYEKYRDQKYLLVFLGINITLRAIPDISSKKTYENCIRSFGGFLYKKIMLSFLICNLRNFFFVKRQPRPWKYLKLGSKKNRKEKTRDYAIKLKEFMKDKILTLNYVKDRMDAKLLYNKSNKLSQAISSDFDVQRWSSFLPPLHNFTVSRIDNVGVEFERLLKQAILMMIRVCNTDIWRHYMENCSYSFGIIKAVQRAVNKNTFRNYGWY